MTVTASSLRRCGGSVTGRPMAHGSFTCRPIICACSSASRAAVSFLSTPTCERAAESSCARDRARQGAASMVHQPGTRDGAPTPAACARLLLSVVCNVPPPLDTLPHSTAKLAPKACTFNADSWRAVRGRGRAASGLLLSRRAHAHAHLRDLDERLLHGFLLRLRQLHAVATLPHTCLAQLSVSCRGKASRCHSQRSHARARMQGHAQAHPEGCRFAAATATMASEDCGRNALTQSE